MRARWPDGSRRIHHERLVTDEDAATVLPAIVSRMDEPLADYAALPTYFVAEVAARTVKVILTGEGADELFGGYRRYRTDELAPFSRLRRPYQATHLFSSREIGRLLGTATRLGLRRASDAAGVDRVNRACARDIEGWLAADNLLVKVDRMTMLCSLERGCLSRSPMVEFALRVPGHRRSTFCEGRADPAAEQPRHSFRSVLNRRARFHALRRCLAAGTSRALARDLPWSSSRLRTRSTP